MPFTSWSKKEEENKCSIHNCMKNTKHTLMQALYQLIWFVQRVSVLEWLRMPPNINEWIIVTFVGLSVSANIDVVVIHDAVRPFVSSDVMERIAVAAYSHGVCGTQAHVYIFCHGVCCNWAHLSWAHKHICILFQVSWDMLCSDTPLYSVMEYMLNGGIRMLSVMRYLALGHTCM